MSKIGLVTVLFKSDDVLEDFFKSVAAQTHKNYILYIIDNSPSSDTDYIIAKCLQEYRITAVLHLKSDGNIGVAAGNNVGIKQSLADGCDYVLLLNNDIEITDDNMFERLLQVSKEQAAMVVPKIFYYDSRKIWMAGGYLDKWRALGVHYGDGKEDSPVFNQPRFITYAPTCFMLIPKDVFDKVGLMDEKYFAYYDDTDFVTRALLKGEKLFYEPSVSLLHKVSSSAGTNSPFYVYYSNRNKIYFARKNFTFFFKYFSIAYTLFARIVFWLRYDVIRKQKLLQGLKDGFKLKVEKD